MERPIISTKDVDALIKAVDKFVAAADAHDRSRDLLAQAQQVVVTEFAIFRTLLERAGVKVRKS